MASIPVKYISPLQFITMDEAPYTHLQQVIMACQVGVDWIQLRMKQATDEQFLQTAQEAKVICDRYGSKLLINDRVHIAKAIKAYGVHVGKEDMTVQAAREILGAEAIIGGTANTADDIRHHYTEGADYIGLGPYRFTTTKKKLSPVLGPEGYVQIMNTLQEAHIAIPVVAIGGIQTGDITALLQTGLHGIAFSGLLVNAGDKRAMYGMLEEKVLFPRVSAGKSFDSAQDQGTAN